MVLDSDLKIIIIDDNPGIHKDFKKILTMTMSPTHEIDKLDLELFGEKSKEIALPKFKIDTATQGKEGVERIEQAIKEGKPYAVAFVDVRMPPGWDGIETIKQIWNIDPNIQVVICTAYSDYTWEETVAKLGIRDNLLILKKPFDNVTVRQLACALIKKWQLMAEAIDRAQFLEKLIVERTSSLKESLSLIRSTIESSNDGILVVSNDRKILDYNKRLLSMLNVPESVVELKEDGIFLEYILEQIQSPVAFQQSTNNIWKKNDEVSNDVFTFKDGRVFERYSQPHLLNGHSIGRVWSFRDITQRYYLEKKLAHQVTHDALTGLPNRILLNDRIEHGIAMAVRNGSKLGVLFLDIDRFKLINDSLGHQAGDELLIDIASRIKSTLREGDTLARLGGDEFVVVVSEKKGENFFTVAHKVLAAFKKPFNISKRSLNVSTSMGISVFPHDGEMPGDLLRNADLAMYRAKREGVNRFEFYMDDMNINSLKYLEIESDIRRALREKEFFLAYQAQFDSLTNQVIGTEVLLRWNHPQKGVMLPMDFIPQAEASGLIIEIGEWVLKTACKQCRAWQDMGFNLTRIAVNISSQQLRQSSFVENINRILKSSNLNPEFLEVEVTENVIHSSPEVVQVIKKIRELGIKVALDDFGTGNSSLGYLRKSTVDRLKIDKSFIGKINDNRNDNVIIRSIIAMARSLGLEVIAEGVETKKQLDFLLKEECKDIQGFYFGKPISASSFAKLLENNKLS